VVRQVIFVVFEEFVAAIVTFARSVVPIPIGIVVLYSDVLREISVVVRDISVSLIRYLWLRHRKI
jgi:hypothetical protein